MNITGVDKLSIKTLREGDRLIFPQNGSKVRIHLDAFVYYN
jgi:hypothetical protein